jgi:site-specific recombinase XerD
MNGNALNLETLIQGFALSCQTEGKSSRTVDWYGCFLDRFHDFLDKSGLPVNIAEVTKDHIRQFIQYLQTEARTPYKDKHLSPATVQGYVRCLKVFFSWAKREDYVETNPMAMIPVPKAPTRVVNAFNTEQVAKLIDVCHKTNGCGYRNMVIMLLMLDCGIRVSELVSIDLDDVDLTEGYIRIRRAKGGRERIVPIGSLVQKSMWNYIHRSRPQPLTEKVTGVFLTDDGLPLTKSGVQQMLRRCGKRAGLAGVRCSPHTFRHTFAKHYLLNGGDIFSLQKILGHLGLASVRVYLNLFAADIKKQHQRFSPVDNLVHKPNAYPIIRSSSLKHQHRTN